MLSLFDDSHLNRRTLLTLGGLGVAGLSLPSLLAAAEQQPDLVRGRSVIFLFQQGGPSQLETFDPKPDAPEATRTMTGTTKTTLPGVLFGETMSRLAKLTDKFAIVRSFQTNNGGHNIQPIVGRDSLDTNIGVHYARVVGSTRADTGMPTNCVLFNDAVCEDVTKGKARGNLSATGSYGSALAPFQPGAKGQLQQNMRLSLPPERLNERRALLTQIEQLNRLVDGAGQVEAVEKLHEQAYRLLLGDGVATALDLSNESKATLESYDTSRYAQEGKWDKVSRGKRGYYSGQAKSIGKLLLLARRLCEAGCGFVTIHAGYDGVWDMHADRNNLNVLDGMQAVGHSFDHAVAAFIEDIEARGLQDKILLIATGEMGRTPKINKRGGRDHWSRLAPLLLYGAGVRGGQIVGRSTKDGGQPATENYTSKHLLSTILHTLFDVGQLRVARGIPDEVLQIAQEEPIPDLA